MYLELIKKPNDIQKISPKNYKVLAREIRDFLIENVSRTGGHLSSNLGAVELTMAIHLSFDLTRDKVIWDVGHQSYTHKILTGRKEGFKNLRSRGGMSGFPKRKESPCDAFDTGHSSTSISAGIGMAQARDLLGEDYHVISVIGDGALTGGLAFEALNNASAVKGNFIIVLNDNTMSISENVGGVSNFLGKMRTSKIYTGIKESITGNLRRIPSGEDIHDVISTAKDSIKQFVVRDGMMFEDMDITYLGPFDGHNTNQLIKAFRSAKQAKGPVLLHVLTKKGKGYPFAEANPGKFHGVDPFDPQTGKLLRKQENFTYTKLFSDCMMQLGKQNNRVVAITAAMADGTGLSRFSRHFPNRFFDVGIAEAHAVTFAAGLAVAGMKPYVAIYSSFLQRAYDSILHDVCMQNLPVTFAVDRAGIVGKDGETHQGIFDLSYLTSIPNLTVMAPKNAYEFAQMFRFSHTFEGPLAIRYPRGEALLEYKSYNSKIVYGKAEIMKQSKENTLALVAIGSMTKVAMEVAERLESEGADVTVINLRFAKPLDLECIKSLKNYKNIFTLEENVKKGGIGEQIAAYLMELRSRAKVRIFAVPDRFIPHGCPDVLMKELGLNADHIYEEAGKALKGLKEEHE
ncbi:MAG: 1-deoxy-D-xylulose-5-phosphate synthase [Lachnospiraceae bacterium]|nr:1-deoxy-D-xylulose-5-phosphate synthase [Lachnospiraceae bacterium]